MATPFTPTTGSQTIGTTEYFLASASTTATYQTTANKLRFYLDLSAMAAGDQFRIRVYEKVNGGAATPLYEAVVDGVASGLWESPDFWVNEGWEVSLKKLAGTDRAIGWALKKDVGDRNVLTIATDAISAAAVAAAAVSKIADGVMNYVIEAVPANATTFIQRLRVFWSVFAAKASGLTIPSNTSEAFRDAADTKDRAAFTMNTAGTRTPGSFDGT